MSIGCTEFPGSVSAKVALAGKVFQLTTVLIGKGRKGTIKALVPANQQSSPVLRVTSTDIQGRRKKSIKEHFQ